MTALFEQWWTDLFLEIQRMIFASSVYALDMITKWQYWFGYFVIIFALHIFLRSA